ncbi:MAG: aminotransferase class I/II-fold pyridoxal phosphate-dependent enzyme [Acidimicrobiales bacterium]
MAEQLPVFALEEWFRRFAFVPGMTNLSPSNPSSPRVAELLALSGKTIDEVGSVSLDYGETKGAPALREAIAGLYETLSPDDVMVTSGAVEAITVCLVALVGRGTRVVLETPIYGSYEPLLRRLGAEVATYELSPADSYEYDADRLADLLEKTRAELLVVNPFNNPTGRGIDSPGAFREVVALAAELGTKVLSDEVFRQIDLVGLPLPSVLDLGEGGVAIGDMTKPWGLGGLRIGWLATRDRELLERALNVRDYTTNSNSSVSEHLAEVALAARGPLIERALAGARESLAAVDSLIRASAGALSWVAPVGGYCGWVEVGSERELSVPELCAELALDTHQLLLPGVVFGQQWSRHVRIGLTAGAAPLCAGLEALLQLL